MMVMLQDINTSKRAILLLFIYEMALDTKHSSTTETLTQVRVVKTKFFRIFEKVAKFL